MCVFVECALTCFHFFRRNIDVHVHIEGESLLMKFACHFCECLRTSFRFYICDFAVLLNFKRFWHFARNTLIEKKPNKRHTKCVYSLFFRIQSSVDWISLLTSTAVFFQVENFNFWVCLLWKNIFVLVRIHQRNNFPFCCVFFKCLFFATF